MNSRSIFVQGRVGGTVKHRLPLQIVALQPIVLMTLPRLLLIWVYAVGFMWTINATRPMQGGATGLGIPMQGWATGLGIPACQRFRLVGKSKLVATCVSKELLPPTALDLVQRTKAHL
jgi:hypothetical protein